MKKHIQRLLFATLAILLGGANSAWAGDKTVVKYSFDDASSPAVTAGSRVSLDYTKTSVITETAFLNALNNTNGDPGSSTISLGSTDLSSETWTLSFDWAAVGGCNSKADHTMLKAGSTTLFDLSGDSNWNTTVTLSVGGTATSTTLPVPSCNKSYRFTAGTGNQMNTTAYWHHFVITGSSDGVKLTITNSSSGAAIVTNLVLSETNVNPTSLVIEPCCGGAIGLDELTLSYYVAGEVIQTPVAAYTAVNGIERTITATCDTEGATLYYSLDNENWTEGASVTVSASGNVYFKAVKGTSESDVLTFAAEAGTEIVLNAPAIVRNANGTVTISADQSKLLLAPTATIYYTYGEENGSFTGSKELTVAADATITAYAEAEGYTKSADATRAVALFPESMNAFFSVSAATKGWEKNAFSAETITASERTYATLLLDEVAWSESILFQTSGAWGFRATGNWYINSNTANSWILVKDAKAGNIVVVDATFAPVETVNATYVEKYSFGTKHAYTIDADGNAEFALIKPSASEMDYFYGAYGYSPYTVDFNTAITTSNHDFKVASNWKHIVHRYNDGYSDYYMSYSYGADTGIESSGALYAGQQRAGDNWDYETTYDFLVTPIVSGEITIYAKKSSSGSPFVEFWSLNETGTAKDTKLYEITSFESDTWTAVTYNVTTPQRIGIRAQYVYLDNFSAVEATIEPEKSIAIATADPTATTGTIYWEQQENGNVLVKYTVTVTNNGEVNLTQGMDNYSISVFNRKTNEVYFTVPVPQDLAIGATSDPFEVSGEVETTIWPNSYSYINMDLKENLQGSTIQRAQSNYKAYEPKFVFRAAESSSTSSITAAEAWGTITESTTKSFEIANTGTAPLTIKSITLPEGFTSDNAPTAQFVLAKGETQAINITQDATATGTFAGTLTIVYLDKDAAEQTYTLAFSATVIGANTWTADFNNSTSTVAYPTGAISEGGINTDYQFISSGNYNNWLIGRNTSGYDTANNKFITPKLHANASEKLAFDVKAGYSSSDAYFVKVYVSTDRKTWGDPVETFVYSNTGSSFTTKTISFDAAGDYYVAFAIYGTGSGIDNLVGLEKVDVAHDLYVKSVSWPDASVKSGTSLSKPSVDIIPLTNEAADAYTVKYVCGETVLAEATSAALTASANSSKTFSFNWTPSVENTTVYENTKVVFDFGGGVTFETETFDLTVTNEPKFHFVNSIPSSKWYEPTDYTTPITFGKTNAAGSKTFYVYNWGSAPLTVKSVTVPAGFTVTPANQFAVAAFDESNMSAAAQAVEITFSATEAGTYSGNMVITYVDGNGNDQTFELAVSGTKLDPSKYYANFGAESNQWPAGSAYQSNVSTTYVTTGDYAITSSSTTNNIFVTPKLKAVAGDKLLFDAKLYSTAWKEGKVVIYAATTREEVLNAEEGTTRQQLFSRDGYADENPFTTDYQTFEVSVPAGEWYLGFEISGRPYVDEIYGLQQVAVAHDWMIASSNIPSEAMQNVASTATVNVLNLGLADEAADSYTVTAYVDGEIAGTGSAVALPMNHKLSDAGTQLSVNIRSPKAGTFPVYMIIEADGYKQITEPVNVTFAEEVLVADAIEVGSGTTTSYNYAPIDFYNFEQARTSDILYTAAQLDAFGIKSGDKITKLAFKGTLSSAKTISKSSLKAWVALSNGDITYGSPDKELMTEVTVFEAGDMVFVAGTNMVTINLPEAITYDGSSDLRIYLEGGGNSEYVSLYFAYDTNYANMKWSNATSKKYNPLLYVTLAAEPATLAGTVTLGDSPVEGATVTLTSEDEDKVQYTGTTNASGEYSIEVIQSSRTYTVTADKDGAAATVENVSDFSAPVDLALVALPELTFGDADFSTTETKANVTVTRGLKAGWNAIILPVTLTADEVTSAFGANAEVAVYSKDEDAENVTIQFSKTTKIVAGTPCLLWLEAAPATAPRFVNKDINTTVNKVSGQSFSFTGVYEATTVKAGDYFVKNGGFKKAGNNNTVKPFRSYLQLNEGASARSIRFFIDDEEIVESEITGIETVKQTVAPQGTYSMSGQKMEGKLRKGLYIINGKKVMVK